MQITDKKCTGCHSCANICPNKAIIMNYDNEGFLYPHIKIDKCINCGLCKKACPLNADKKDNISDSIAYMAYNTNCIQRNNSSSGGIFVLLAEWVIKNNGVVYGAAYDEKFHVTHIRVDQSIDVLQTSKYVQSEIGQCFQMIKEDLGKQKVLFSGTPCQIAGLKAYLHTTKTKDDNLLAVDIICHGVPSPLVWEAYLRDICKGRVPINVNFRDKTNSWRKFSLAINFNNNERYIELAEKDLFMRGFLTNLFLRPSCYSCQFKGNKIYSDITLGDFWGIENIKSDDDFERGVSAVLVHTDKGKQVFDAIADFIWLDDAKVMDVKKYNSALTNSVFKNPDRETFFKLWNEENKSVIKVLRRFFCPSLIERVRKKLYRIFRSR